MALFLLGIVLLVLLTVPRLGGYRFLVHVGSLVAAYSDIAGDRGDEVLGTVDVLSVWTGTGVAGAESLLQVWVPEGS